LALFGRRPLQRVVSLVIPATKNLHNNGLMQCSNTAPELPSLKREMIWGLADHYCR
jgi:hypothetical protein